MAVGPGADPVGGKNARDPGMIPFDPGPPVETAPRFFIGAAHASAGGDAHASTRPAATTPAPPLALMLLSVGGIAAFGVLDERSLGSGIRLEISREQQVLATVLAGELRGSLKEIAAHGPVWPPVIEGGVWWFGNHATFEPRRISDALPADIDHRLLLWRAGDHELRTFDGEPVAPRRPAAVFEVAAAPRSALELAPQHRVLPGKAVDLRLLIVLVDGDDQRERRTPK